MNRNNLKSILIFFVSVLAISYGQSKYPVDTLLTSKNVPLFKKAGILPIAIFQRFSYNANGLNCQFYPSCSNYGAQAINDYGLLRGSFVAADRIVRCNPNSLEYHLKRGGDFNPINKQLIDPVQLSRPMDLNNSPVMWRYRFQC